jgi:hypothetical protein
MTPSDALMDVGDSVMGYTKLSADCFIGLLFASEGRD